MLMPAVASDTLTLMSSPPREALPPPLPLPGLPPGLPLLPLPLPLPLPWPAWAGFPLPSGGAARLGAASAMLQAAARAARPIKVRMVKYPHSMHCKRSVVRPGENGGPNGRQFLPALQDVATLVAAWAAAQPRPGADGRVQRLRGRRARIRGPRTHRREIF